ncbi:hypothetical protein P4E94_08880 [Pontiellaceae bacterium B12219]|nr:hypothetical protein [Pontiellaceae bacterium B12219]
MTEPHDITKFIPAEVWVSFTDILKQLLHPLTATTHGIGRMIEQKFNALEEAQKLIIAQTIHEASKHVQDKRTHEGNYHPSVKPEVMYIVFDNAEKQCDESMRSLWANLVAREFIEGSIHPEIARLLSKLTDRDLILLSEIYSENSSKTKFILKTLANAYSMGLVRDKRSFNHEYLQHLRLIDQTSGSWFCTSTGKALLRSVDELK